MLIIIGVSMFLIVMGLLIVSFIDDSKEETKVEKPEAKTEEKKPFRSELCSRIPKDGTVEWARYVLDNYTTDYFKPVDIARAAKILDGLNE